MTGHDRWMRADITSSLLAATPPGAPRACVFGEIRQDGFRDAFCLVVDDDGKLEYQVERGAGSVEVDRDLALIARHALDRLIDNPDSRLHNGLFRAAVWAATTTPARTETSGLLWVATFEDGDGAAGAADLADLLPADRNLARALARMLASPVDLAAQRAFDDAIDAAAAQAGRATQAHAGTTGHAAQAGRATQPHAGTTGQAAHAGTTGQATHAGTAPPRLDLTRTVLTAAGVTAALLGDTDTARTAVIGEIAVTGLWPADGDPLDGRPPSAPVSWHGMDWQLIG